MDVFRKFGRQQSEPDVLQTVIRGADVNEKTAAECESEAPIGRRSSAPSGTLALPSPSQTPPDGRRHSRLGSIAESSYFIVRPQPGQVGSQEAPRPRDPLGLTLVYSSPEPLVDLIFVHGLGGTSERTWSWQRDPRNFWPTWLGQEAELSKSRIFTFGYNADFAGPHTPLNILDFAKDLLFRMKTYSNAEDPCDRPVGKHPTIFVMHSMGGLVVKKASIIGRSDEQYAGIVSQIRGMLFLGTPHRGSTFADTLNNILRTTPGFSAKSYISELKKSSGALQDINEQYRTACKDVELVSLYETQKTAFSLGVRKLIVDKDSAVLGYPTETSGALNANHHDISKFSSIQDPNYVHVRNILRMLLSKVKPPDSKPQELYTPEAAQERLENLLGIVDDSDDELEIIRDRISHGSCHWILRRESFLSWTNIETTDSKILWLTGLPAVGKSVLSSFIIDHLQKDSSIQNCHYYFFKSEHQTKRTIGQMLRNIALQIAKSNEAFRKTLVELYDVGGLSIGRQKVITMWETIFEGILSRQQLSEPFFWVIDGLDEADHPETLIRLFSRLRPNNRFRILIVSRSIRDLGRNFGDNMKMVHEEISINDTLEDIRSYTSSTISTTLQTIKSQDDLCSRVLAKAHGSFLWVTLALEQLKDNWHTQNDVDQVLNDLPEGMEPLYVRMVESISEQAQRPRTIASRILTWTVCSFRPLEIEELEVVLASEFGEFLHLKDTVTQICGNFVVIEKSRVSLIHDTARQFLLHRTADLPISIDHHLANEYIASTCMNFIMDPKKNWRRVFSLAQSRTATFSEQIQGKRLAVFDNHPFLQYAVTWWSYHVSQAPSYTDLHSLVSDFLEHSCLVWINAVALLGDMRMVTRAAQYLKLFIKKCRRKSFNNLITTSRVHRDDKLREWVKDLIRVVGRFGTILTESPQSIHRHIIPFCPKGTIISRKFGRAGALSVTGISSEAWDDCLARLTMGDDECATMVRCKGSYFVTLVASGTLVVWHVESFAEARRLYHREWITTMECSKVSNIVATAGTKTIRVWDISTGEEVYRLPKTYQRNILALSFGSTDDELLIGYDDSSIQCYNLTTSSLKWRVSVEDPDDVDHACPHLISFSPDACQVVLGYRGRPLLAWSLNPQSRRPQKCIRPEDRSCRHRDTWKGGTPECVLWHPESPVILVLHSDTCLVEWNIEDDIQREIAHIGAREMAISPDGNLFLTSDHNGTLSVWTVPEFRLVYQVKGDDMVRSLTFSADGQRFYVIRGPLCHVWEPEALIRPDDLEREEFSSSHDTLSTEPVSPISYPERPQITALICDSEDKFYCCGKDSGAVVLHELSKGEKIRKLYGHSSVVSVVEMAWSSSQRYIASADDCGRVIAKRLQKPKSQGAEWKVYPLLDVRPGEAVSQLLFSSSEDYLLISSSTSDCVWSIGDKKEMHRRPHRSETAYKWVNHAHDPDLLVRISCRGPPQTFIWKSLDEVHDDETGREGASPTLTVPPLNGLSLSRASSMGESLESIERVVQLNKAEAIFEIQPSTGSNTFMASRRRLVLLDMAPSSSSTHGRELPPPQPQQESLKGLAVHFNRLVGVYQEHVVFLDHQHSFCTLDTTTTTNRAERNLVVRRHFFLPNDWLTPAMLRLCTVNSSGTVLCPKNGEVAIIRSGIKF